MVGSSSRTTTFHPPMRLNTRALGLQSCQRRRDRGVLDHSGAIASSRTVDPSIGEFEDAPNRPHTRSGSMSQMGQKPHLREVRFWREADPTSVKCHNRTFWPVLSVQWATPQNMLSGHTRLSDIRSRS
jgi:hypothetical protein